MAKAKLMPISELGGKNFFIPSYQRGYKWTTTQMKELLQDLYAFSKEKSQDYYCLQPVIVKKKGTDGVEDDSSEVWEVVDGQQRLTAIWLIYTLYYAFAKSMKSNRFSLEYEKKDKFTELFKTIEERVEASDAFLTIADSIQAEGNRGVDALNLIENIRYITKEHKEGDRNGFMVLNSILENADRINIIWYELEDEDPIQTFANINANKIELTNAELLKALLLHARKESEDLQTMALQWDNMEKGLRDSQIWNFLVNEKAREKLKLPVYSTHIDLLFEIWCAGKDDKLYQGVHDKHAIFRKVSEEFEGCSTEEEKDETAKNIWTGILEIYETLLDWYEDYNLYHQIGLILAVNADKRSKQKNNAELIKELYHKFRNSTRKDFEQELLRRMTRDVYGADADSLAGIHVKKVLDKLGGVGYEDRDQVRRILLLYNVSLLLNSSNQHERFPFDLYNKDSWDVEHVNPQTPLEMDNEEKKAYLESYRHFLGEWNELEPDSDIDEVINDISACLSSNTFANFKNVCDGIAKVCGIENNDNIQNLVLLDAETNRSYHNACFFDKRKCIIAKEQNNRKVGIADLDEVKLKYIPIGTKCVFLKGFENVREMIVWGKKDREAYLEDIAQNITKVLGGVVSDEQSDE